MNQLTDLPDNPALIPETAALTSRIRREGTRNLLRAAAKSKKSVRLICQSVAWELPGKGGEAVEEMEHLVLNASGIVLRYGQFYGPGTYYEYERPGNPCVSITSAAAMTLEALKLRSGIYLATDSHIGLTQLA